MKRSRGPFLRFLSGCEFNQPLGLTSQHWQLTRPIFFPSVVEQPLKIPFLAAIILGVNAQRPELVAELLARAGSTAESYMKAGEWREVKLVLRLLACLQCLYDSDGIFTVLDELFSRAVTLQTTSSEDVSSVFILFFFFFLLSLVLTSAPIVPRSRTRQNHSLHNRICHDRCHA